MEAVLRGYYQLELEQIKSIDLTTHLLLVHSDLESKNNKLESCDSISMQKDVPLVSPKYWKSDSKPDCSETNMCVESSLWIGDLQLSSDALLSGQLSKESCFELFIVSMFSDIGRWFCSPILLLNYWGIVASNDFSNMEEIVRLICILLRFPGPMTINWENS